MSDYVVYWQIVNDILSQIRKDCLNPKAFIEENSFHCCVKKTLSGECGSISEKNFK